VNIRLGTLLLIIATNSYGDALESPQDGSTNYVGPREDEVILQKVFESPRYNSSHPLSARIKNSSRFYLDRLAIECTLSDSKGIRLFRRIVFKSNTILNTAILGSDKLGIPPGATSDVGLYTTNNEWRPGDHTYNCVIYGVNGSE